MHLCSRSAGVFQVLRSQFGEQIPVLCSFRPVLREPLALAVVAAKTVEVIFARALSPISLAEIVYLVEKNRLSVSASEDLQAALSDPEYVIEEAPFTTDGGSL